MVSNGRGWWPIEWCGKPPTQRATQHGFNGDIHEWMESLQYTEWRVFSQFGEDGVLHAIFSRIGVTDKFFVEFGVQDGSECSTRFLREFQGWSGKIMDGGHTDPNRNLTQHFFSSVNIVSLFQLYAIPKEFDHLTVDVDLTTYHIANALFKSGYRPRHAIVECNPAIPLDRWITYPDATGKLREIWPYYGASVPAIAWMMLKHGYWCVHISYDGDNMYFVRNDVLTSAFPEAETMIQSVATRTALKTILSRRFGDILETNTKWNTHVYWPRIRNNTWVEV